MFKTFCIFTFRTRLIISFHQRLGFPSGLLPSGLPTKILYVYPPSLLRATCPAHLIVLNLITGPIFGEQYISLSSSLCSFLHSPVTASLLGPNIFLSTLFSSILSLCSSLIVSDQVSHPYKTTDKTIVMCVLIFVFGYQAGRPKILLRMQGCW